jgi:DNA-directed RNA polymerase specialized sigma24 family protein
VKDEQKRQIIELYLQCLTFEQISEKMALSTSTIHYNFEKFKSAIFENPPVPECFRIAKLQF